LGDSYTSHGVDLACDTRQTSGQTLAGGVEGALSGDRETSLCGVSNLVQKLASLLKDWLDHSTVHNLSCATSYRLDHATIDSPRS
jgi:hypothetical protein